MVVARDGFRKIYDLRENVLPNHIDTTRPTDIEWGEFLVNRPGSAPWVSPLNMTLALFETQFDN